MKFSFEWFLSFGGHFREVRKKSEEENFHRNCVRFSQENHFSIRNSLEKTKKFRHTLGWSNLSNSVELWPTSRLTQHIYIFHEIVCIRWLTNIYKHTEKRTKKTYTSTHSHGRINRRRWNGTYILLLLSRVVDVCWNLLCAIVICFVFSNRMLLHTALSLCVNCTVIGRAREKKW